MAASCRSVGPEITFTPVTLPAGSTSASMVTSPATWFDLASAGYVGGTDLIRRATWTSPPTTGLPATGTGIGRFVRTPEIGVSSAAGTSPGSAGAATDAAFAVKSFACALLVAERDSELMGLLPSADGVELCALASDLAVFWDRIIFAPTSTARAVAKTDTTMNPPRVILGLKLGAGSGFCCSSGSG